MSAYNPKRVVVTGIGAVTPAGLNFPDTWDAVLDGRVNAQRIRGFDAGSFPCKIAYEVSDNFALDSSLIDQKYSGKLNRAFEFGVNAATEAVKSAKLLDGARSERELNRTGVCLGVGMISPDYAWYERTVLNECYPLDEIKHHYRYLPNTLTKIIGGMVGAQGGNITVHTACASSGQSLGEAWHLIASGELDVVVTGGADSMVNPFHLAGFCLLGTLSTRNHDPSTASRPFDVDRDGFVLGEGACVLIFEELGHAIRRGANILAEVKGYGCTESAYRITDLEPEGNGPIQAMQAALAVAALDPEKIGYVNAHGTSTALNDVCESIAIGTVFGHGQSAPYVSSSKSVTGHLISAAGAIEFAVCINALRNQVIPPSTNVFNVDPQCPVKVSAQLPIKSSIDFALSNSVGFGGSNTALIAGRFV